jgi:hypothetical protein
MNNRQVAHEWAHGRDKKYANNNVFAVSGTIYSYGRHFPMARFYGLHTVLVTNHGYSVSTAKHLGYVRNAIPSRCKTFYVDKVCTSGGDDLSKVEHKANHADMLRQIAELVQESQRPKIRQTTRDEKIASAERLRLIANDYRQHFKLGGRDLADIGIAADRLAKSQRAADKRAERERLKAQQSKLAEFADWKDGKNDRTFYDMPIAFRFRKNGNARIIQTSKGAEFSVSSAIKAFPRLLEIRNGLSTYDSETTYRPDVASVADDCLTISGFRVESVSSEYVTVGCHIVEWSTIMELAGKLHILPQTV